MQPDPATPLRTLYAFPDSNKYYNFMYDRFAHTLLRFSDYIGDEFFIILNAISRDKNDIDNGKVELSSTELQRKPRYYVGLEKMSATVKKIFLNRDKDMDSELDNRIQQLKGKEAKGISASMAREFFDLKDLSLRDLYDPEPAISNKNAYFGELDQYYSGDLTENQELEKQIIDCFIEDTSQFVYQSLPLIVFAQYDGTVHIVYKKEKSQPTFDFQPDDKEHICPKFRKAFGEIIKLFSYEAEAIILDWEIVGSHLYTKSAVQAVVDEVCNPKFQKELETIGLKNTILTELGYAKYYKFNETYYRDRLKQSDEVTEAINTLEQNSAIVNILLDSYAHNISAHCLTALNWKMKHRAKNQKGRESKKKAWAKNKERASFKLLYRLLDQYNEMINELDRKMNDADVKVIEVRRTLKLIQGLLEDAEELIRLPQKISRGEDYLKDYPGSLSTELQPLIAYLMEKGAFWSGVTRDWHYGGIVENLFKLLWSEFLNNSLYLGTMAQSEGVHKIKLKVIIFEPAEAPITNTIDEAVAKKVSFSGILGEVDVTSSREEDIEKKDKLKNIEALQFCNRGEQARILPIPDHLLNSQTELNNEIDTLNERSKFVQPGKDYFELKKALEEINIFLPGSVVGKHALFTILENEIRNVKHYTTQQETLEKIVREGLDLTISIQQFQLQRASAYPLYQIGVWLNEPTGLTKSGFLHESQQTPVSIPSEHSSIPLVFQKYIRSYVPPIDPAHKVPLLGGTQQDKICASLLFNNAFSKVQNGFRSPLLDGFRDPEDFQNERDYSFYPWITSGSAQMIKGEEDIITDFQIQGYIEEVLQEKKDESHKKSVEALYARYSQLQQRGYLKKFFNLWGGAIVQFVDQQSEQAHPNKNWDNSSRFKFICTTVDDSEDHLWELLRVKYGVVRIIKECKALQAAQKTKDEATIAAAAYSKWLEDWLGSSSIKLRFLDLSKGNKSSENFYLTYFPSQATDINIVAGKDKAAADGPQAKREVTLPIAHGDSKNIKQEVLRVREHGIYRQYYQKGILEKEKFKIYELLETLMTKVVIFDSRSRQRIKENEEVLDLQRKRFIKEKLNLEIYSEKVKEWKEERKLTISDAHFVVIHLTFIENLIKKYHPNEDIKGSMLGYFMQHEIPKEALNRNNFMLIVTTGRGRKAWLDDLKKTDVPEYQRLQSKVSFRPIEPILSSIENAKSKMDDFELKHYLLKILFGS